VHIGRNPSYLGIATTLVGVGWDQRDADR